MKRGGERRRHGSQHRFPPAFCGGLIEAAEASIAGSWCGLFPPAFCGGLIEAQYLHQGFREDPLFPPAFCGGLIEAEPSVVFM